MATQTILSKNQQKILDALSHSDYIAHNFYWGGGTVLAEFYLRHRLSEDLDFFSEEVFDPQAIAVFFKQHQKELGIKKIDFQTKDNRNLFFLHLTKDIVKTEFTYFPFPRIEQKQKWNKLWVDSLLDIAVNKLFTIYMSPRSRDSIDLYCIIQKTGWTLENLRKKAKIKFDYHIDPLQLGAKFLLATELKDYPRMVVKIKNSDWQNFFIAEAKKMKDEISK
jgi:hypothetical protein